MPVKDRPSLSSAFLQGHRQARIIVALEECVAAKGYRAVTVADVVRQAGIARNTFYEAFGSKDECACEAIDRAVAEAVEAMKAAVAEAGREESKEPRVVEVGLGALLKLVEEQPHRARLFLVEGMAAPTVAARRDAGMETFVRVFQGSTPEGLAGLHEMLVGGAARIIAECVTAGRSCVEVEADLREFLLAPFV